LICPETILNKFKYFLSIIALLLERYKKIDNERNKKVFNIELLLVFELFESRKINEIIIRKSKILMKFSL